jgi:hypothetical protein
MEALMRKLSLEAVVVPLESTPAAWSVEAIDQTMDGTVFVSVFYGADAKERAVEYAHAKYMTYEVRQ